MNELINKIKSGLTARSFDVTEDAWEKFKVKEQKVNRKRSYNYLLIIAALLLILISIELLYPKLCFGFKESQTGSILLESLNKQRQHPLSI